MGVNNKRTIYQQGIVDQLIMKQAQPAGRHQENGKKSPAKGEAVRIAQNVDSCGREKKGSGQTPV
ncbi:MAG TPA: hypothetical protein VM871_11810 [Flavisolibacter sp.]|nr:hypothetical protein [Flavisolibacter sp.]